MRSDKEHQMYKVNELLDRVRTEFYELLDYDPDVVQSSGRETRRREVLHLVTELRILAEQL